MVDYNENFYNLLETLYIDYEDVKREAWGQALINGKPGKNHLFEDYAVKCLVRDRLLDLGFDRWAAAFIADSVHICGKEV